MDTPAPRTSLLQSPGRWAGFVASFALICGLFALLPAGEGDDGAVANWSSVIPPVIAVLLAVWFRQLVAALVSAVAIGSMLAYWEPASEALKAEGGALVIFTPIACLIDGFDSFIMANLADEWNLFIFLFTFGLVGMVHVMSRSGGVHGLIDAIVKVAKNARSTRIATALMGLVVFFDDYANSVVVGTTMRSLSDRMRISREKLAYIVDSTAAPVSGVALISTWVAYEAGLFNDISEASGLGMDGYEIFMKVLPFRFYCLAAMIFVFVGAILARDFGPMLKAERRAMQTGKVNADDAEPLTSSLFDSILPPDGKPRRARNAIVPILVVVVSVIVGMMWSGLPALAEQELTFNLLSMDTWRETFGAADSAKVLFWASIMGSLVAIAMAVSQRIVTVSDAAQNWGKAIPAMKLAVAILLLAWAIKSVCDALGTNIFLTAALEGSIPLTVLPLVTFVLAAAIAFSTGTSWGTMGILLPVAMPLAIELGNGDAESMLIMFLVASAVLDGAIFGDHCSPISDTTVLSSLASGCDHLHHVRTQMPYAVVAMTLAAGFGYVAVAFGMPVVISYPAILVGTVGIFLVVGKPIGEPPAGAAEGA